MVSISRYWKRLLELASLAFKILRDEGFASVWRILINRFARKTPLIARLLDQKILARNPSVSIVIPVFNALSMTQECIRSIFAGTKDVDFEIVIVDNASKDGTSGWLRRKKKKHSRFQVFRMEKNIGFGPAVNFGIQHSKGEFVVILNNDTLVSSGWLTKLLSIMGDDPSLGVISPVTNYLGEGPQIDDNAKNLPPDLSAIDQYASSIADRSEIIYEPSRLVFFCVLLRRDLVDRIGYLDEGYTKGNFEDDDYCLRARLAGYRLAIARNAFVYHHGSITFKKNRISHTQYMEKNRELFYRKAGRVAVSPHFSPHWPSGKRDISVIVRTKNRPLLLQRALTSLANQTFRHFEIILVNDGGEDVDNVIQTYGVEFPVTYVRNPSSLGRTAAANEAIKYCRGEWISYLDDDDIVYPWHLEALLQAAKNNIVRLVYSDYNQALFMEAGRSAPDKLVGAPSQEFRRDKLFVQNYIPIHTWLFARDSFEQVGMLDETLDRLEDYEFLLRLSAVGDFYHLKRVTCEYRFYLDSANSIYTDRQKTLDALEHIYRLYPLEDMEMISRRQEVMDGVKKQIQVIDELKKRSGDSVTESVIARGIIRLVTGL